MVFVDLQVLLEELVPVRLRGELGGELFHHHLVCLLLADLGLDVCEGGTFHLSYRKLQNY